MLDTYQEAFLNNTLKEFKQINATIVPHDDSDPFDVVLTGCFDEVKSNINEYLTENEVYF